MLGRMGCPVLGQYDLLVRGDAPDAGGDGAVFLVGPNLATLEQRFGFDPIEFRTWVLVHELIHRAQFTGVPWMRAYFTGLLGELIATGKPRAVIVGGLMSLLEGHGAVTMSRAAGDLVLDAERCARMLAARRAKGNPLNRLLMRLTGMEGKLDQYAAGERFIAAVEAVGGPRAIDVCWTSLAMLPSIAEIRDPQQWLRRIGRDAA